MNVHILSLPFQQDADPLLGALHPAMRVTRGDDVPADIDILVAGRPQREHLTDKPHLRALVIPWAGLPAETRTLMQDFPHVSVHNLHYNAIPVAETALGLLLAAAKFFIPADRALRRHDWRPRYQKPYASLLLAGRTALVLGYGAIGRRVGALCHALGMRVWATRRRLAEPVEAERSTIYPAATLPDLLPEASALILCLPHTAETEGLIGADELKLLPRPAVLVNVGRAAVVDEEALYAALRDGRLTAAALDVWYRYPADEAGRANTPPAHYPFHELENVVMSPHRSSDADHSPRLLAQHLAELLNTAARGDPLPNRVDVEAGY